jgi:hypothetical protein
MYCFILFKLSGIPSPMFPMLGEMFPQANYIFNLRNLRGTMASLEQMIKCIPYTALLAELSTGKVRSKLSCCDKFVMINIISFGQFSYGIGSFPYDDPNWWRFFIRHNSRITWPAESFLFNYLGQVYQKSLIRTECNKDKKTSFLDDGLPETQGSLWPGHPF